jgi:hypothetical protein
MKDTEFDKFVKRLMREVGNVEFCFPGEEFNVSEYAPPYSLNWWEFIERLRRNGLEIVSIKEGV